MSGQELLEQAIGRVAAQPDLPQDASKDVDQESVRGVADVVVRSQRSAGERDPELKLWRGHETRFYSERRSNSTRARVQSAAI